jgi:signal transduction histidine kinase
MLAQARRGSLDAVVAQSRRRNLAVSLGVVGVLGASVILLLVTSAREQRLVRQQLEFVASVSHELRTPLAVIRSAGENLADGVVSGAQVAEYGDLIQAEGRRLTEMVDRVMDFAGMTGGAAIRSRRRVAAGDAVREAVSSLSYDAAQRQIQVVVEGTDPAVSGDPAALTTAMRNVVGNAIKYSEPGAEVRVAISSAADTVRIVVSDRGIGIDREDLPHVFEPFYRGRRAVDSQVRGSGVGLSVVRQVVVAHGGRIRVEPREGGGTQVTIDLPLAGERIEG